MTEETDSKQVKPEKKPKFTSKPIRDVDSPFEYHHFLGLILVVGFLVIGSAAGTYGLLEDLMVAPCLGCLGLYPNVELEFTFDTVEDQPHPDFVLSSLETEGPVFIEFTQNDENCPPCARMRPHIEDLEEEYGDSVVFYIINVNENENKKFFRNDVEVESLTDNEEKEYYHVYDLKNIADGRVATPTFIVITLDEDESGNIRESFSVGYGEFKDEDAKKTKEELAEALDYSLALHHHYLEMYISE